LGVRKALKVRRPVLSVRGLDLFILLGAQDSLISAEWCPVNAIKKSYKKRN